MALGTSWRILPTNSTLVSTFTLQLQIYKNHKLFLKHGLPFTFCQFNTSWCCKFELKWSELFMTWARLQHFIKIASSTHVVFCWFLPSAINMNSSAVARGEESRVVLNVTYKLYINIMVTAVLNTRCSSWYEGSKKNTCQSFCVLQRAGAVTLCFQILQTRDRSSH